MHINKLKNNELFITVSIFLVSIAVPLLSKPSWNDFIGDDWAYYHMVSNYLKTNTFQYNGWPTVSLGFQLFLVLPIVAITGSLITSVKILTLILSAITCSLLYNLFRSNNIPQNISCFLTTCFVASPMYIILSVSYMTEIYSMLLFIISMLLINNITNNNYRSLLKIILLLFIILVAGSIRQIFWIFGSICALFFLLNAPNRKSRVCLLAAFVLFLASAYSLNSYFISRPYAISSTSQLKHFKFESYTSINSYIQVILSVFLHILPIFTLINIRNYNIKYKMFTIFGIFACLISLPFLFKYGFSIPYAGNVLTFKGIYGGSVVGDEPDSIHKIIRWPLTVIVLYFTSVFLSSLVFRFSEWIKFNKNNTSLIYSVFSIIYIIILFPWCLSGAAFDRYMFILIPIICIFIGKNNPKITYISYALLTLFGIYSIHASYNYHQQQIALQKAENKLIDKGFLPEQIRSSFQRDGWVHLLKKNYINDDRIQNPKNAFSNLPEKYNLWKDIPNPWWWKKTNAISPDCVLVLSESSTLNLEPYNQVHVDEAFPVITYTELLSRRKLYIHTIFTEPEL
jgi:hypothetical protein